MKKIKNILVALVFSLIIGAQAIVSDAASLDSLKGGIYTIKNNVSHENETGMAMARTYVSDTMTLEKSNGSWYYTIKFSGAQYMSNHAIYVNGGRVSHTVVNKSSDTLSLKFKTSSISPNLKVSMYVSAMQRDVQFGVIPQESTLSLVKVTEQEKVETPSNSNNNASTTKPSTDKKEEVKEETTKQEDKKEENKKEEETDKAEETKEEKTEEDSDKTEEVKEEEQEEVVSGVSEEKSSNNLIFIGAGAVAVIAIGAVAFKKFKAN